MSPLMELLLASSDNARTMGKESRSTMFHRCSTSMFTSTAQVRRRTACKEWVLLMDGLFHSIRNGLAYMDMRPPTQDEYETYDHVVLTSDVTWVPTILDNETDLSVPNDNLIVDIDEEYYSMMHARRTLG